MKRVLTALVLLIIVALFGSGALWLQNHSTEQLIVACDSTMELWNNGAREACKQQTADLIPLFEEKTRWFPFFLHHKQVESIQEQVATLPLLFDSDNNSDFPSRLTGIRTQLEILMDDEWPTPENIL